jgi:hypothetical protein
MAEAYSPGRRALALGLGAAAATSLISACATAAEPGSEAAQIEADTYTEPEVISAAERVFGAGAEGVAAVVRHVFQEQGRPTGYIEGEEGSGAFVVGLRYGHVRLYLRNRPNNFRIYWRGPTIGFDTGGNASKVFALVYRATDPSQIYNYRFPGVDGSAYFIGGVGANYVQNGDVIIAPMRAGVGWRLGASVGYLHFSARKDINPF